jgi:voltage-gated sodium channel
VHQVKGDWFARFAIFVTVVNIVVLSFYHQGASERERALIDIVDLVCLMFFIVEALLKIIVMGKSYFKDGWLQFDFTIVLISILAELIQLVLPGHIGRMVGQPLESVKAIRALRIFESSTRFRVLMSSVWDGIRGGLVQLAALIFTILFMFAVVGMELFGNVDYTEPLDLPHDLSYEPTILAPYQRFDSFSRALLACFQVATTSGWHELMFEVRGTTVFYSPYASFA